MIIFRRLPGLCYNHVYAVALALGFSFILVFFLLSWGFICSNIEPWRHVNKLCKSYEEGKVMGDMCEALCSPDGPVRSYSCRAFHAGKETVFAAMWSNSTHQHRIVIKSAATIKSKDELDWTNNPYPSEQEFISVIKQTILSRFNVTLTQEDAIALSKYPSGSSSMEASEPRRREMIDIWNLLQDNEYTLCRVYEKLEVFPKVVGTCGSYFFTEYLEPVLDSKISQFIGQDGSSMSWESRLNFGSMLLDLVDSIDTLGLLICDLKPGHFGLASTGENIKLLDLDVTYPKATADSIVSDGRSCIKDEECGIFDCASKCDETNVCKMPVTTSNVQVLCSKVFLGMSGSGSGSIVHLGGLLLGDRTPAYLASMLRQCSKGNVRSGELGSAISSVLRSINPNKADSLYGDY